MLVLLLQFGIGFSQEPVQAIQTKVVLGAEEAYKIRKNLLAAAQKEIIICYFNFTEMEPPYTMLALLKEARKRGVKTQVIVDKFSSTMSRAMHRYLLDIGAELKYFNPIVPRRLFRADRRLHDKFIAIDNEYLLVGGRNITTDYFEPDLEKEGSFYDIDALFSGKPAQEAVAYFRERWHSPWMSGVERPKRWTRKDQRLYDDIVHHLQLSSKKEQEKNEEGPSNVTYSYCTEARFVANHPSMMKRNTPVEDEYLREIDSARTSIDFLNSYVLFSERMYMALQRAKNRGVRIRIGGNSLKSTDLPLVFAEYLNMRRQLLKLDYEIYEFIHAQTMHAKIAIFDERKAIVGSFNLDPRSAFRNSETIVVTDEPVAVAQLADYFQKTLALSTRIDKSGRPEGHKKRYHEVHWKRRLETAIYRYTIAPLLYSFL